MPELVAAGEAEPHVVGVPGAGDLERPLAVGELDRDQVHPGPRHLRGEALVEPPAAPVADGVGDAGDDVEQVGAHGGRPRAGETTIDL